MSGYARKSAAALGRTSTATVASAPEASHLTPAEQHRESAFCPYPESQSTPFLDCAATPESEPAPLLEGSQGRPGPTWTDSRPDEMDQAWTDDVHGSVSTGLPATHRGSATRAGWRDEVNDPDLHHSGGWSVSRSGVSGRIAAVTGDKNERSSGVAANIDRNDMRLGLYSDLGTPKDGATGEATIGSEGAQASWSDRSTQADGSTLGRSASMSIGNNGILAKAGGSQSSTSAGYTLGDPATDLTGHRARGAATQRTTSFGGSATASADIRPGTPYSDGDQFTVPYTMVINTAALASAGLTSAALEAGGSKDVGGMSGVQTGDSASFSAAIGRSATAELTGVKHFPTLAEAEAWHQIPIPDGSELAFLDPSAALGLDEGERSAGALSVDGSVSASASGMGPSASIGLSGGVGAGLSVERLSGDWVLLTRDLNAHGGLAASLGAPGLDVGGQTTHGARGEQTWKLDLSTEAGNAAYSQIILGQTPAEAPGVQPGNSAVDSTDAQTANVNVGPLGFAVGQSGLDRTITRPDGSSQIIEDGRQTQRVSAHRLLQPFVPSVNENRGAVARTDYDAEGNELGTGVLVVGETKSNSARQNAAAIGTAAGVTDHAQPGRQDGTPGQWTIEADYGPNTVEKLAKAAEAYDLEGLGAMTPAAQILFIESLRAAGEDRAAQRQAIQDFGRTGGDPHIIIRSMLKGKGGRSPTPERYLGLSGSETWIGLAGFEALENTISDFADRFSQGDYAQQKALFELQVRQENRLLDLGNESLYPEVPASLRVEETGRIRRVLARVEALLLTVPERERLASPVSQNRGLQQQFTILEGRRAAMDAVYDVLLAEWETHKIDHGSGGIQKTPHERLGDQSMLLFMVDGPESGRYREAKALRTEGERMRVLSDDAQAKGSVRLSDGSLEEAEAMAIFAVKHLDSATAMFSNSAQILAAIREEHSDLSW